MMKKPPSSAKICSLLSLGCPKNLVDSESILGGLVRDGWGFDPNPSGADLVILNTCGFIESAREEAYRTMAELIELKRKKKIGRLVVCGCLVRADGEKLTERFPDVDAWFGPFDETRLSDSFPLISKRTNVKSHAADAIPQAGKPGTTPLTFAPKPAPVPFYSSVTDRYPFHDENRLLLTVPHSAYLKIADGCDRFCSYCAIPSIRGRFTSKPLAAILDEAKRLADSGVRELILIAQETTFWGNDLYGKPALAELLANLKGMNEFAWIRLLYAYPLFWDDALLDLIGFDRADDGGTVILPYVDLPLQHCNDAILKRMNRRVGKGQTEELLARLREKVTDLTLRTTFITGFPGETDEAFEELIEFAQRWRFERAGVFDFSPESGTPAAKMDGQLPAEVKTARYGRLYETVEEIVCETARARKGETVDVLIDSPVFDDDGRPLENFYIGRTYADSPDIDPVVYVTGENLTLGGFYPAEVVDAQGFDLIAVVDRDD